VINADEDDDVDDPFGTEQCFGLPVQRVVDTMLDRQGPGDAVGHDLLFGEFLGQPPGSQCAHRVIGESRAAPTAEWAYNS
jgi:hypothetical protein